MELTERKKRILQAIVETYIETAEPVGSKVVAEKARLDVSTATIRNEMADLTELGLLEQPHTSAGRIPSAAGYRLYVNELMDRHQLTLQETERINQALNVKMEELDRVIDRAGKVLSQISDYPVFTAATVKDQVTVKRYDLLVVEERAFIAVVMTDNSVVKNKLVHMAEPVSDTQIQLLSAVLNSLDSAEDWGTWDMLGGGLLTTMAKHGHLDDAQAGIGWAQQCLSRFRTELADVRDMELPQVQVGEFATFADYFFDGIFVDWYIQSRINDAQRGVEAVDSRVCEVLNRLQWMDQELAEEQDGLKREREGLLLRSSGSD